MIFIMRFCCSELDVLHDSKLEGAKAALSRSGIDWPMLCGCLLPYIIPVGESCKNKMSNANGREGTAGRARDVSPLLLLRDGQTV